MYPIIYILQDLWFKRTLSFNISLNFIIHLVYFWRLNSIHNLRLSVSMKWTKKCIELTIGCYFFPDPDPFNPYDFSATFVLFLRKYCYFFRIAQSVFKHSWLHLDFDILHRFRNIWGNAQKKHFNDKSLKHSPFSLKSHIRKSKKICRFFGWHNIKIVMKTLLSSFKLINEHLFIAVSIFENILNLFDKFFTNFP